MENNKKNNKFENLQFVNKRRTKGFCVDKNLLTILQNSNFKQKPMYFTEKTEADKILREKFDAKFNS